MHGNCGDISSEGRPRNNPTGPLKRLGSGCRLFPGREQSESDTQNGFARAKGSHEVVRAVRVTRVLAAILSYQPRGR